MGKSKGRGGSKGSGRGRGRPAERQLNRSFSNITQGTTNSNNTATSSNVTANRQTRAQSRALSQLLQGDNSGNTAETSGHVNNNGSEACGSGSGQQLVRGSTSSDSGCQQREAGQNADGGGNEVVNQPGECDSQISRRVIIDHDTVRVQNSEVGAGIFRNNTASVNVQSSSFGAQSQGLTSQAVIANHPAVLNTTSNNYVPSVSNNGLFHHAVNHNAMSNHGEIRNVGSLPNSREAFANQNMSVNSNVVGFPNRSNLNQLNVLDGIGGLRNAQTQSRIQTSSGVSFGYDTFSLQQGIASNSGLNRNNQEVLPGVNLAQSSNLTTGSNTLSGGLMGNNLYPISSQNHMAQNSFNSRNVWV